MIYEISAGKVTELPLIGITGSTSRRSSFESQLTVINQWEGVELIEIEIEINIRWNLPATFIRSYDTTVLLNFVFRFIHVYSSLQPSNCFEAEPNSIIPRSYAPLRLHFYISYLQARTNETLLQNETVRLNQKMLGTTVKMFPPSISSPKITGPAVSGS